MISNSSFKKNIVLLLLVALYGCADNTFSPDSFEGDYGFVTKERMSNAEIELGRSLFFDKILSGNKNISCATCHHPSIAGVDAVSLSLGEGATGLGVDRQDGVGKSAVLNFIPRNSPALFNLGSSHFTTLFHDGRVELNQYYPNGIESPVGLDLPNGLNSLLAAQAMFPVTSVIEMAGVWYENDIGGYAEGKENVLVWHEMAERIQDVLPYVSAFQATYGVQQEEIKYVDVANAIGAFIDAEFRSIESAFDQYIGGDKQALNQVQKAGMRLFYGKAKCANCHSGVFQTDNGFHSIALPQVGPGKRGSGFIPRRLLTDFGRELVTGNPDDRYKFRTPSLRNVELTAPYGHDGAYRELESIVRHHLAPSQMMAAYDCEKELLLPKRKTNERSNKMCRLMENAGEVSSLLASSNLPEVDLDDKEIEQLLSFLESLTDDSARDRSSEVPKAVLSGLSVVD